jgi:MFS family permease
MIAASVMMATFMVVLDSSVANVALPHIAGNLSASTDESTWVLTSYLVANAIMLPASGWIARRIGRKRLLIISILIFTAASLLLRYVVDHAHADCGPRVCKASAAAECSRWRSRSCWRVFRRASTARRWPSMAWASLSPRSSAPRSAAGSPTATPGAGSSTSISPSAFWRSSWSTYTSKTRPICATNSRGRLTISALGCWPCGWALCNLVLDKGQESDWFEAPWICWTAAISMLALVCFIVRELADRRTDRAVAHLPRPQLCRRYADHLYVRLRSLCRHGHAAAVSANADGLFGAAKRPLRESARHRRHGFDGSGWNVLVRRTSTPACADGLRLCPARLLDLDIGQHQSTDRDVFCGRAQLS